MKKLCIFDVYVKIISMHEFIMVFVHNLLSLFYFISYTGAGNEHCSNQKRLGINSSIVIVRQCVWKTQKYSCQKLCNDFWKKNILCQHFLEYWHFTCHFQFERNFFFPDYFLKQLNCIYLKPKSFVVLIKYVIAAPLYA